MPTNEFEKQVQKQLDDFQLNPSSSVWKKVEEQIRKKKRRRLVFIILLPLALGLLGYMGYQFLGTGSKTEMARQPVAAKNERALPADKNNVSAEVKEEPQDNTSQEINGPALVNKEKITIQKKTTPSKENKLQISSNDPSTVRRNKKPVIESNERNVIIKKEPGPLSVINNDIPAKQDISVTVGKPRAGSDPKNEITKSTEPEKNIQNDNVTVTQKDIVPVKKDNIKTDVVVATDSKNDAIVKNKKGKLKITWGIDFSAGMTSNNKDVFSFSNSMRFADASYSSTNPGSGGGTNPLVIIPSSPIKAGPAFRIGIAGELQVSKRSRFSTGFEYRYASNRIKTGPGVDTAVMLAQVANGFFSTIQVNRVYRGQHQNDHTNSYHFIALPLWYHLQINKGKKLPMQWNAGISVSYLVGSNALVYDPSYGGIYYRNKEVLNKTHFNVGTGFSLRIKSSNGIEWVLGPELSFDMSKIMNSGYDKIQYLLFSGVNAKVFFQGKKNK